MLETTRLGKAEIIENLNKLLKLQGIRQNLDFLNKEIDYLKGELEKNEIKYQNKQFQYKKNIPYLEKAEKEYNEIKNDIADIMIRIEKCEEKKKKIKTIREFKALNKELDSLNQENGIKENQIIDKSEDLEYKKEKMKKIEENLKEIEKELEINREELTEVAKKRRNDISKEIQKKEAIEKKMDPTLVSLFNRIYENKETVALAKLSRLCCSGCNTVIPKQIAVNVKKQEEFIFCPFCSRMLYFEEID